MQRRDAVRPLARQREAVAAGEVVAGAAGVVGADLEAGGVDQAVDLVGLAVGDDGVFGDALDAAAFGIDQRHVRPVEGRQVVVVEAGALAELVVPGLERLGGPLVLDHRVNAGADLLHLLEVGELNEVGRVLLARRRGGAMQQQDVADDLGPAVIDQVLVLEAAGDEDAEIVHPALLPAGGEGLHPVRIGRRVVAHVDGRGRALEDVELLRRRAQMRHALHRRRAGADDADALVGEAGEVPLRVAAGIGIVPAAGVEGMALEALDARNAGQLGPVQRTVRLDDEAGLHRVAAIGADDPARRGLVPVEAGDFGLEAGVAVEIEVPADGAAMLEDLGRGRVFGGRHEADLLQQRQVDVTLHVAGGAGIAVPVPGAAEIAALLDDAHRLDAGLAQPRPGEQAAEAAADHHHIDLVGQRRAGETRLDIGVFEIMGERPGDLDILLVGVVAQALVALGAILRLQRIGVEAELGGGLAHRMSLPGRPRGGRRLISCQASVGCGAGAVKFPGTQT